uniref:TLC domain-containing protein n=1 Tax=Chaetoceros debilis TaxID=122233 RepID=A0A7S3Q8F1_9STRA|mmetsp:Transcript_23452/g.35639  ORF Transcript_23452/g.35639 Transcript_23452/m.35639 type:complete len:324 (+) Transcript_23452:60-1031(+)
MTMIMPTSFLLPEDLLALALKITAGTTATITVVNLCILFFFLQKNKPADADDNDNDDNAKTHHHHHHHHRQEALDASHQLTNGLINFGLGVYGTVICVAAHYNNPSEPILVASFSHYQDDILNHIIGYATLHHISFAAMQVGYNLWNLPYGYFLVNEPPAMIAHHIMVIITTSLSAYSNFGNRIHVPFFLGMYEVSTVPLAIMNYLKVKGHREWVEQSSVLRAVRDISQLSFAVLFLGIRIVLGTPHIYCIASASFHAAFTKMDNVDADVLPLVGRMWIAFVFMGHIGLAMLQYYWAFLIVKGLAKMFMPSSKSKKEEEKKKN